MRNENVKWLRNQIANVNPLIEKELRDFYGKSGDTGGDIFRRAKKWWNTLSHSERRVWKSKGI